MRSIQQSPSILECKKDRHGKSYSHFFPYQKLIKTAPVLFKPMVQIIEIFAKLKKYRKGNNDGRTAKKNIASVSISINFLFWNTKKSLGNESQQFFPLFP